MKTSYNTALSSYKIAWVEFKATKGIVTKHDRKALGQIDARRGGCSDKYYDHFSSREKAVEFLTGFTGKLDKQYECRIFSDKQFGMRKKEDGYAVPFTEKQRSEVYYIG